MFEKNKYRFSSHYINVCKIMTFTCLSKFFFSKRSWADIFTLYVDIVDPVETPSIEIYDGNHPNITLICSGIGNPLPEYAWNWTRNTTQPIQWEKYATTQNITLTSVNDSGMYKCEIKNSVAGIIYLKNANITVNFSGNELYLHLGR